jgi:hypothetical protein
VVWHFKYLESSHLIHSIITDWLAWKPGNGKDIRIGADPMVGAHSYLNCLGILFILLKLLGIEFLAQARNLEMDELSHTSWKKVETLGLEGELQRNGKTM